MPHLASRWKKFETTFGNCVDVLFVSWKDYSDLYGGLRARVVPFHGVALVRWSSSIIVPNLSSVRSDLLQVRPSLLRPIVVWFGALLSSLVEKSRP